MDTQEAKSDTLPKQVTQADVKKETKSRPLPKHVTEADLKKLVLEHGPLFPVTVKRDGETFTGLFKKPSLGIISAASTKEDNIAQGKLMYNSCVKAIDPEVEQDDELMLGMISGVGKLFRVLQAEVGEPYA